ncbi:MAG: diacylglycerol kinase [Burkholderiaceae bacterium]
MTRIAGALRHSLEGLQAAWATEHAFRQELALVLPGLFVACLLPLPVVERLLLGASLVWVLVVELLNSAIEAVVDRVSLERHPLSKKAKDLGSAAVFVSLLMAAVTWAVIIWPLVFA